MDWKAKKWNWNLKSGKDRWLIMLAVGLMVLILAFPSGKSKEETETKPDSGNLAAELSEFSKPAESSELSEPGSQDGDTVSVSSKAVLTYEQELEKRLEELLSHVDGVGRVEVMIVLKSSEEKVWRVDRDTSYSMTQEKDQNGGSRTVENQDISEDTILSGQTGQEGPLLEKELKPEIGGVVVSAEGGGSPKVQAEISAAVEALFDVPSHKIKVLKRIE